MQTKCHISIPTVDWKKIQHFFFCLSLMCVESSEKKGFPMDLCVCVCMRMLSCRIFTAAHSEIRFARSSFASRKTEHELNTYRKLKANQTWRTILHDVPNCVCEWVYLWMCMKIEIAHLMCEGVKDLYRTTCWHCRRIESETCWSLVILIVMNTKISQSGGNISREKKL